MCMIMGISFPLVWRVFIEKVDAFTNCEAVTDD